MPESIIVLGGGYVGCEFGDVLDTVGGNVTIVQGGDRLLAREDEDIAVAGTPQFTHAS